MRLSSLSLATFLLFSSVVLAQHQPASTPSSPPPAPAPSAAPSPAPATSATAPASAAPSASSFHSSEASAPAAARAPESHITPSSDPSPGRVSGSTFTQSSSGATAPAHAFGAEGIIPGQRITGEDKIEPAARIGENPPEKEHNPKPGEPGLRRRICDGEPCKQPAAKSELPESDLRRPVCPGGSCKCPAGQTAGKGGCIATEPANQAANQCQPGEWWNGGSCVRSAAHCSGITSRAEMLLTELRGLSAQIQAACSNDPSGAVCDDAKVRREQALAGYRMLQNEALPECREPLPEPPL